MSTSKRKSIAVVCPNNIIKFYYPNGKRDTRHPNGFYNKKHLDFLKSNFDVRFSEE